MEGNDHRPGEPETREALWHIVMTCSGGGITKVWLMDPLGQIRVKQHRMVGVSKYTQIYAYLKGNIWLFGYYL